jgi:hypothetical protein
MSRFNKGANVKHSLAIRVSAILLIALSNAAAASSHLSFATRDQGQAVLASSDDFVVRLSPFDRAARMKTNRVVSEQEYLSFVRRSVLDWSDEGQKKRVARAADQVEKYFADLGIRVPDARLVKTNGSEEGGTAYTRANVIVLPTPVLADPKQDLVEIISHELFHIISRNDVALRNKLYETIGFKPCAEFAFTAALASRKITDPDAPRNDHCILLKFQGQPVWATPVLYANRDKYDLKKGGVFFDYLQFKLALVDASAKPTSGPPVAANAGTRFVDVGEVSGFFEQVGNNTEYIIHPEEILADNFSYLVTKKKGLKSPKIPMEILRVFKEQGRSQ